MLTVSIEYSWFWIIFKTSWLLLFSKCPKDLFVSLLLVLNCYVGAFIPFCIYFDSIKVRFLAGLHQLYAAKSWSASSNKLCMYIILCTIRNKKYIVKFAVDKTLCFWNIVLTYELLLSMANNEHTSIQSVDTSLFRLICS